MVPKADRIIELAILRFEEGHEVARYVSLFSIPSSLPRFVQVLTRIRQEDLLHQPSLQAEEAHIHPLLSHAVIVGHNINFDLEMLRGEGIIFGTAETLDTALLASLAFPEAESWSLPYLSTILALPHEPVHRALGDALATAALLSAIGDRIAALPSQQRSTLLSLVERGPEAYRLLFTFLLTSPPPLQRENPLLSPSLRGVSPRVGRTASRVVGHQLALPLGLRSASPAIWEVGLDPQALWGAVAELHDVRRLWVAVKNLEASLRRDPLPEHVTAVFPPGHLLDPFPLGNFALQSHLTPEECTLNLKLALYHPRRRRDLPLHGTEHDIVNGVLAATRGSSVYRDQFRELSSLILLDHRHLLDLLRFPIEGGPSRGDTIMIDDASMLEDTATKTLGWECLTDPLRAVRDASDLVGFLDLLQLWVEEVRSGRDRLLLSRRELATPAARGVRANLTRLLEAGLSDQPRRQLEELVHILNPDCADGRIVWVELTPAGGHALRSVPEDVAGVLGELLYSEYATVLLSPPGGVRLLSPILHLSPQRSDGEGERGDRGTPDDDVPLRLSLEAGALPDLLTLPLAGHTIILLPSKRAVEDFFIHFALPLEDRGVQLIAQGIGGGIRRMQAEFSIAPGPAILALTPWLYEGIDLPPDLVSNLTLVALPFDHPNHTIIARRSERYHDGFKEYQLPRMLARLFRVLRTFSRHRVRDAQSRILDPRLTTRPYGHEVVQYLKGIPGVVVEGKA